MQPERTDNGWRWHLVAILLYAVGYYIFTCPATHTFTTRILTDGGDGPQNLWNNWWVRHAVANLKSPWSTDYLYYPEGTTLVTATLNPFNGFMTVPLCWVVNQVTAFNLMVVFSFVMTGYGMFLLARELTNSYWGSVFAGAVLTFSPFHLAHAFGHMQLVSLEWLPFFLWSWIRLLRAPNHRRALIAAATLFLVLMCDYYYTMYAIMGGALIFGYMCVLNARRWAAFLRDRWLPLATFTAASTLACGPLLGTLIWKFKTEEFVGQHSADYYSLDVFSLVIPGRMWRFNQWSEFFWSHIGKDQDPLEFASHLGLSVWVLAVYGFIRSWRTRDRADSVMWLVVGGTFYALSLGPRVSVWGTQLSILSPYKLLEATFPMLHMTGAPSRMAVMAALAAGVLAARGLAYAGKSMRFPWVLAVPLVVLFIFESMILPQPTHRPDIPPVIEQLCKLPKGCVVGLDDRNSSTLYFQTIMEQPMPSGYVARVPKRLALRRAAIERLLEQGRYTESMEAAQATYLLRNVKTMPQVIEDGLKRISVDDWFELYVRDDNPIPGTSVAKLLLDRPSLSLEPKAKSRGSRTVQVRSRRDPRCRFAVWLSRKRSRVGIDFQGHRIPLENDAFLKASALQDSPVLRGNWGLLDENGCAKVVITTDALKRDESREFWACVLIFEGAEAVKTGRVTDPVFLDLSR